MLTDAHYDYWLTSEPEDELAEYIEYRFNNLDKEELELISDQIEYDRWLDQIINEFGQKN